MRRPLAQTALALIATMSGLVPTTNAFAQSAAIPELSIQPTETGYAISGRAVGIATATLTGELTVLRTGPAGEVNSRQSEVIEVRPGEETAIGRISLSAGESAQLTVTLSLTQDGQTIAVAETRLGPPDE